MKTLSIFVRSDIGRRVPRRSALVYFAAALGCLACPVPANADIRRPPGVRSIRPIQHVEGVKIVYNVVLDRRFKVGELDTVALHIKRAAPKTQTISILYFLRGMEDDGEAWATGDFNPDLNSFELRINEAAAVTNLPDTDLRKNAEQ